MSIISTCVLRTHSYIFVNDILYNYLAVIRSVAFKIPRDFDKILLLVRERKRGGGRERERERKREKERSRNIMRIKALY